MTTITTSDGKTIKVIPKSEMDSNLTPSDKEMDLRALEAVEAALNRAKICKKPIAGYDKQNKLAYIEYPNKSRKYMQ